MLVLRILCCFWRVAQPENPNGIEQFNCKLFYGEFSAGMSIRLCQLESRACAWFPGNKGHCTHLQPSWRAQRETARGEAAPLSLGVEAPRAAYVMAILSDLTGSELHTACLCASDKLYDRLQIILVCSATLLVSEKGAPTICAVLS